MKNLLISVAALTLCGLQMAGAQSIQHEFRLSSISPTNPPLRLLCQGTNHSPPLVIQRVALENINRSTVRGLIEAYHTAVASGDTNLYGSLFVPGQRNPKLSAGGGALLTGMTLSEVVDFGSGHIAVVNLLMGTNVFTTARGIIQQGGAYYFTSEWVTNRGFAFYAGLVTGTLYVHQVSNGGTPGAGVVLENACAPNAATGACITFAMSGTNYSTALFIPTDSHITPQNQELGTVDGTLSAVAAAVAAGDVTWFLSLVCPEDIDRPVEIIGGTSTTLRASATNQMAQATVRLSGEGGLRVIKKVEFSGHAFVLLSSSRWLVFKSQNGQWLLTDSMNRGDKVACFIRGAGSPNCHFGIPDVLP